MTGQETLQAFLQQVPVVWIDPMNKDLTIEYPKITKLVYWRDKDNKLRVSAICYKGNSSSQVRCKDLDAPCVDKDIAVEYICPNKCEFAVKAFKSEAPICKKWDKLNILYGRIEKLYFRLSDSGKVIVDIEVKDAKSGKMLCRPAIEFADVYTYLKRKENKNVQI